MTESILIYLVFREIFGIRIEFMERLLKKAKGHLGKQKILNLAQILALLIWVESSKYHKK